MADLPSITMIVESAPAAPKREGGKGREPIKWDEVLDPVRKQVDDEGNPQTVRAWTYPSRNGANGRVATVRKYLRNSAPDLNYQFVTRQVPEGLPDAGQFGVYVTFRGTYTPAQIAENAKAHKARSERVVTSQQAALAAEQSATEGDDSEKAVAKSPGNGKTAKNAA